MTVIELTPPGGSTDTLQTFTKCSVTLSATGRTGSFSLTLISLDNIFDKYVVGTDVRITLDDNVYRGWVLNNSKQKSDSIKYVQLSGMCYTGKTQKLIITESYINETISEIVTDLCEKYIPGFNRESIYPCAKTLTIKFNEVFLFDALEQLATLAGYDWYIDEPVPEEINITPQGNGWYELVTMSAFRGPFPADDLYPADYLYPF